MFPEDPSKKGSHRLRGPITQFVMDRPFIPFSSLALVSLCACTMLHFYFRDQHSGTRSRAPGAKLFAGSGHGISGGLVLCVVTCDAGHRDLAFVWRGPRGSSVQRDVQSAMKFIPYVLVHPSEFKTWPRRPFDGPYLAMVSTRPENFALRAAIRRGWGEEARYPRGAFRLIFFLAEPSPGLPKSLQLKKDLLTEAKLHNDMAIESYLLSSTRAMMLEWAPEYANSSKLLLWARDDAKINASDLLKKMQLLTGVPGDVFGRVSATDANGPVTASNAHYSGSPWNRLEQCAYFLKMGALIRLSTVYEDVPRASIRNKETELVTEPLASRANLSLVAVDHAAKCTTGAGSVKL